MKLPPPLSPPPRSVDLYRCISRTTTTLFTCGALSQSKTTHIGSCLVRWDIPAVRVRRERPTHRISCHCARALREQRGKPCSASVARISGAIERHGIRHRAQAVSVNPAEKLRQSPEPDIMSQHGNLIGRHGTGGGVPCGPLTPLAHGRGRGNDCRRTCTRRVERPLWSPTARSLLGLAL